MRFLIVDDSSTMRRIIINTLYKLGHQDVAEAGNGKEGLDRLSAGAVDVIITDWNMPEMIGIDFIRAVRPMPSIKHTPVLLVTTNALESVHGQLREIIKTRGQFPNDGAATKLIWLALRNITAKWARTSPYWRAAMNQFAILYEGRFALNGVKCDGAWTLPEPWTHRTRLPLPGKLHRTRFPTAPHASITGRRKKSPYGNRLTHEIPDTPSGPEATKREA